MAGQTHTSLVARAAAGRNRFVLVGEHSHTSAQGEAAHSQTWVVAQTHATDFLAFRDAAAAPSPHDTALQVAQAAVALGLGWSTKAAVGRAEAPDPKRRGCGRHMVGYPRMRSLPDLEAAVDPKKTGGHIAQMSGTQTGCLDSCTTTIGLTAAASSVKDIVHLAEQYSCVVVED